MPGQQHQRQQEHDESHEERHLRRCGGSSSRSAAVAATRTARLCLLGTLLLLSFALDTRLASFQPQLGAWASPSHRGRHHAASDISLQQHEEPAALRSMEDELLPQPEHLAQAAPQPEPQPQAQAQPQAQPQQQVPNADDPLIVQTKKGRVKGATLTATTGKKVDSWFGIPYAQKPLGEWTFSSSSFLAFFLLFFLPPPRAPRGARGRERLLESIFLARARDYICIPARKVRGWGEYVRRKCKEDFGFSLKR